MELSAIQEALKDSKLDGWLFYDHHFRDPIAYRILKIKPPMCTRRWYYFVPASGEPTKLTHKIENENLDGLPGRHESYALWSKQREQLATMLAGRKRVAMQYSPLNDIPYIGLVDAGTIELVKSFGVEIVSSANLVQMFEARWSAAALQSHLDAGKVIHQVVRQAFRWIGDAMRSARTIGEYEVQQEMVRLFEANDLESDAPPLVAVNAHSGNPHYSPDASCSTSIRRDDFVLLDVWGKQRRPGAVYFDITWTGFVGDSVPSRYQTIFEIVRAARDAAVERVRRALRSGEELCGFQVDDAARSVIAKAGYGECFIHRTGHSIGEDVHGNGANMDNFETHDDRRVMPGTCFSIEPGIYRPGFGVRSEVDVYIEERDARVTGEIQQAIVPILAGGT
ncbi:MAG: M24 family metallopeptidase [Terriglobia bacterium]